MNYNTTTKLRYNGFLGFILSLMPGAGQMYMGLMKRGMQLMVAFFGIIALSSFLYLEELMLVFLIPIWFFSFFDSHQTYKAIKQGEDVKDIFAFSMPSEHFNKYHIGIGLIVIGLLALLRRLTNIMHYMNLSNEMRALYTNIERSIIPILLIILGIWIIKRSKKKSRNP
ncbi:MAG: hypothetical protein ACOYEJ_00980 [Mahellales bacterium]